MTLVNGSWDDPPFGGSAVQNQLRTGWTSNRVGAPVGGIETWRFNATNGVTGLLPYPEGSQYLIEMDSAASAIEQVFTVPAAAGTINWSYSHHRRNAADRIQLRVGDALDPPLSNTIVDDHTATNNVWNLRSGSWAKPAGVTSVRFRLQKISPLAGTGSLVDAAHADFVAAPLSGNAICGCCPIETELCRSVGNTEIFSRTLDAAGRVLAANVATFANFAGSGVDVTISLSGGETLTDAGGLGLAVGVAPPTTVTVTIAFSSPVMLRHLDVNDLDLNSEQMWNFSTPFSGVDGNLIVGCLAVGSPTPPCVRGANNNTTGRIFFPLPSVTSLTFNISRPNALGEFLTGLAFDLLLPGTSPAYPMLCDGVVRWFDIDGQEVDASLLSDCPEA